MTDAPKVPFEPIPMSPLGPLPPLPPLPEPKPSFSRNTAPPTPSSTMLPPTRRPVPPDDESVPLAKFLPAGIAPEMPAPAPTPFVPATPPAPAPVPSMILPPEPPELLAMPEPATVLPMPVEKSWLRRKRLSLMMGAASVAAGGYGLSEMLPKLKPDAVPTKPAETAKPSPVPPAAAPKVHEDRGPTQPGVHLERDEPTPLVPPVLSRSEESNGLQQVGAIAMPALPKPLPPVPVQTTPPAIVAPVEAPLPVPSVLPAPPSVTSEPPTAPGALKLSPPAPETPSATPPAVVPPAPVPPATGDLPVPAALPPAPPVVAPPAVVPAPLPTPVVVTGDLPPAVLPPAAVPAPEPPKPAPPEKKPLELKPLVEPPTALPVPAPTPVPTPVPAPAPPPAGTSGVAAVPIVAPDTKPIPVPPPAKTTTDYDVDLHRPKPADSYAAISEKYYGSPQYAAALRTYNRGAELSQLKEVQVPPLHVIRKPGTAPNVGEVAPLGVPAPNPPLPTTADGYQSFRISKPGMTMRDVAKAVYGSEKEWAKVDNRRNARYRPDEELPVGAELFVPAER